MTQLTERLDQALAYAAELHRGQTRKGTAIPYVSHVLAVAALVLEDGGDEDEAIAALLHDAAEDAGGRATLEEIRRRFGDRVAGIVEECSDTLESPKPPWRPRKEAIIAAIPSASPGAIRVELADKLHNARAILADYRLVGEDLWSRFNAGREDVLWYHQALVDAFAENEAAEESHLYDELRDVVDELLLVTARCPECGSGHAVEIVYGDPAFETFKTERGEIELGGCLVGEDSPRFRCRECETPFGRLGRI